MYMQTKHLYDEASTHTTYRTDMAKTRTLGVMTIHKTESANPVGIQIDCQHYTSCHAHTHNLGAKFNHKLPSKSPHLLVLNFDEFLHSTEKSCGEPALRAVLGAHESPTGALAQHRAADVRSVCADMFIYFRCFHASNNNRDIFLRAFDRNGRT